MFHLSKLDPSKQFKKKQISKETNKQLVVHGKIR
jgi:hypothetical protein